MRTAARELATGSTDDTVKLWSMANFQDLMTLPDFGEDVGTVMFDPTGNALAVGSTSSSLKRGQVQLWRVPSLSDLAAADKNWAIRR